MDISTDAIVVLDEIERMAPESEMKWRDHVDSATFQKFVEGLEAGLTKIGRGRLPPKVTPMIKYMTIKTVKDRPIRVLEIGGVQIGTVRGHSCIQTARRIAAAWNFTRGRQVEEMER